MDTPYNRRVPLPPKFRRPHKRRSLFSSPQSVSRYTGWPLYAALAIVASSAAYWSRVGAVDDDPKIVPDRTRYSIAGDVEEARTLIHHIDKFVQANLNTTLPSLHTGTDVSVYALSAATSFVKCHDDLALEFARTDQPDDACDTLFERILNCQYQFTRFHEHHKTIASICKNKAVEELAVEIARIAEFEHRRARDTTGWWMSPVTVWIRLKETVGLRQVHDGDQDNNSQPQDQPTDDQTTALRTLRGRVLDLLILSPEAEEHRQNIQELYGRQLQPFVAAGCGQTVSHCVCEGIEIEHVRGLHKQASLEIGQLESRLSNGISRKL